MRDGKIITFYSYKGGVGRTMALANVAFMAAMHGYKVLVMDWDLEAPGLHYYFKGFLDSADAKTLRNRPGVMDLLWRWRAAIEQSKNSRAIDNAVKTFSSDAYFSSYVIPIELESDGGGSLDLITAGAADMADRAPSSYGDVLSNFVWPKFFSEDAGGKLLQSLREWAKREYDFVFIDSRTGMADVAGICTVQMPDIVALCFVLNRQNIDGTAGVAGSIKAQTREAVKLNAVPMRVSASGTSEEADARARGIYELAKAGGFTAEAAHDDFKFNAIRSAANVPYYETVLPVIVADPATDPLLLNYLRMANRILGTSMEVPSLDEDWVNTIRRRLQPRLATSEYVLNLRSVDPLRAAEELMTLIASATDTVFDGGDVADDYVVALVQTAMTLTSGLDGTLIFINLMGGTLNLVRAVYNEASNTWRGFLIDVLERYLEINSFFFEDEEELALIEELDALLSTSLAFPDQFKRAQGQKRAVQIFLQNEEFDAASQAIADWTRLQRDLVRQGVTGVLNDALMIMDVEISLLRGDLNMRMDEGGEALKEFNKGIARVKKLEMDFPSIEPSEIARVAFELNSRVAKLLASTQSEVAAAEAAVVAAQYSEGNPQMAVQFVELVNIVLAANNDELLNRYCEEVFSDAGRRVVMLLPNYHARSSRSAIEFLTVVGKIVERLAVQPKAQQTNIAPLIDASIGLGRIISRRKSMPSNQRAVLREALMGVVQRLAEINFDSKLVLVLLESFAFEDLPKRLREPK